MIICVKNSSCQKRRLACESYLCSVSSNLKFSPHFVPKTFAQGYCARFNFDEKFCCMQQLYTVEQLITPYAIPSQFLRRSQHLFIIDVEGNRLPALVAVTSIYKNRGAMFTSYWLVFNWLRLLLTEMRLHLLPIDNISTVSHLPVHSPYTGTIIVILLFFVFQQSRLHKHA